MMKKTEKKLSGWSAKTGPAHTWQALRIGSWVGAVLGITLANWQRGEVSAAGFGWTVLGCGIGSLLVSAVFSQSSWRHRKERTGKPVHKNQEGKG
ncbi:MAG: hypothetical protein ACI4I8_02700 [Oscillospiraceae bacterium]